MSIVVNPADVPKEELFNLDHTLAAYILPRLIAFRDSQEFNITFPSDLEGPNTWVEIMDKMILAFRAILHEFDEANGDEEAVPIATQEEIEEGLNLFAKWFRSLWT